MDWKKQIAEGMKMIIAGCKKNETWTNCRDCPFDEFCSAIDKSGETNYSIPDRWEEEGYTFTL